MIATEEAVDRSGKEWEPDWVVRERERLHRQRTTPEYRDRWAAYMRQYRAMHREQIRAYNREWMRAYRARQK